MPSPAKPCPTKPWLAPLRRALRPEGRYHCQVLPLT